jgi:hypothetical protein
MMLVGSPGPSERGGSGRLHCARGWNHVKIARRTLRQDLITRRARMSQRPSGYQRKQLDRYQTPAWVTAALVVHNSRARHAPSMGTRNGRRADAARVAETLPRYSRLRHRDRRRLLTTHTPCNRCVRFATTVASGHATLATKRTLLLTWAGLSPAGSHQLCLAHLFDHLVVAGEQRHVMEAALTTGHSSSALPAELGRVASVRGGLLIQKFSSERGDKPPLRAQPKSSHRCERSPSHQYPVIGQRSSGPPSL